MKLLGWGGSSRCPVGTWVTLWRDRRDDRRSRPADYGPQRMRTPGKLRKRSASGQAAAKASRTRLAVSTTRAAIFKSLSRSAANSTFARSRTLGMASRTASINQ